MVLRASSGAEPMDQVVGIFGVAAAVLQTVCTHNCDVKRCRQTERESVISNAEQALPMGQFAQTLVMMMILSGTCGVYDVSIRLRSTTGLHADAHVLPLRQSALGGEVAGYIQRNYRLI